MITPLIPYINVSSPLQASLLVFIIPEEAIGWMLIVYGEVAFGKEVLFWIAVVGGVPSRCS
tara:strand:- start:7886 stop:8068 length:183 start_codon:yes stop_codon:yes gene_type:complete